MARPASPDPKSEYVVLRMTVGEALDLDNAVATTNAASRSAYVRDCVRRVVAADKKKAVALRGRGAPREDQTDAAAG